MGGKMKIIMFCSVLFVLLLPSVTSAHSGNTDSYGGHTKSEDGTYHCHSGECLEDAKEEAYDYYFPLGQEDGETGENRSSKLADNLYDQLDSDIAEYTVPYAIEAYKDGYNDTASVWEKYKRYVAVFGFIILAISIVSIVREKKKRHRT